MRTKREAATYLPYKKTQNGFAFFLQKRAPTALRAPNMIGTFGGGLEEGENPESGLYREIEEELNYRPTRPIYFSRYEFAKSVLHVFAEEVEENFESLVDVREGEYGKFFTLDEIANLSNVNPSARCITAQFAQFFDE